MTPDLYQLKVKNQVEELYRSSYQVNGLAHQHVEQVTFIPISNYNKQESYL